MKTADEAINYAVGNLPDNYIIEIRVEKSSYGVAIINPKGEVMCMEENSLIDDIIIATDEAKRNE